MSLPLVSDHFVSVFTLCSDFSLTILRMTSHLDECCVCLDECCVCLDECCLLDSLDSTQQRKFLTNSGALPVCIWNPACADSSSGSSRCNTLAVCLSDFHSGHHCAVSLVVTLSSVTVVSLWSLCWLSLCCLSGAHLSAGQ